MTARPLNTLLRLLSRSALYALIAGLILVLIPTWMPAVGFYSIWESIQNHRFLKRHAGQVFFCYSSRRQWNEFVLNNVLPALPPDILAVQMRGRGRNLRDARRHVLNRFMWKAFEELQHPFLIQVLDRTVAGAPLHKKLLSRKGYAARDPIIRQQCREILIRSIEDLTHKRQHQQ